MDNQKIKSFRVKPIFAYLKDSVNFPNVGNSIVARVIFIIELGVIFGGYLLARPYLEKFLIYFEQLSKKINSLGSIKNQLESFDFSLFTSELYNNLVESLFSFLFIVIAIKSLSYIISLFYGSFYYFSQTNPDMSSSQRISAFFRRLPKIIIFNVLFYVLFYFAAIALLLTVGVASRLIPIFNILALVTPLALLIINTLFVFKNFMILEFDIGVFRNFKKSLDVTKGCKRTIVTNALWPVFTGLLLNTFSVNMQNPMLSLFIASFLEVIIILVSQRLIALMFIDAASLERVKLPEQKSES